jgi:hypothetical protein
MFRLSIPFLFAFALGCGTKPADVCDRQAEVIGGCFTSATATIDSTTCESQLENCTSDDLDAMMSYLDCVETDCDLFGDCVLNLSGISSECGATGSSL